MSNPTTPSSPSIWDDDHWVWVVALLSFALALLLQFALLLAPKIAFMPTVYTKIYALCAPSCVLPAKEQHKDLVFLDSKIEQISSSYYKVSFSLENKAHYFLKMPWLKLTLRSDAAAQADTLWISPSDYAGAQSLSAPFERKVYSFFIQSAHPQLEQFEINFAP